MRGFLADTRPLGNPHFRRLWTANIITVVGAQLTVVAVPAQIYAETGSSAYVGLTGVFGLVPLVVFGLWGGALADVFDRRTLLVITTSGLIGTSALFWLQAALGGANVWLLLTLFAVQQAFFAVNQPTRSAVLPRLLPDHLLPAANSLNATVFQAGAIAGPLVGGILIPVLGYSWLYLVDTITLFATLGAVVRLPALPVEGAARGTPGLRSVIEGVAYLRGHPVLMMSFVVDIIAMVFGMPRALFPEIAHEGFGGPSEGGLEFALLFAGIPAGGGGRRRVLRLGVADRAPGPRRRGEHPRVGRRDGRLRSRGGRRGRVASARRRLPRRRGRDAGRRGCGRHGLGRLPQQHAAERRRRRGARPAAGDLHRGRRRRPARRRRRPRGRGGHRGHRRRGGGRGGVLVVVGTVVAALAAPVFWRYRVARSSNPLT
ncbi:MFS transporter [Nocardioides sp. TF02-7]|uniref:MFS transporter n=1 Tax=Nocardioides sp. TF02-7 TaxID=2917724 RepID=UPI001F052037|nr:MFS transporter [Nocardioides sp. TF02-7]UMG94765.1 MFS transporter [Nocardioides sp. TF02-7]